MIDLPLAELLLEGMGAPRWRDLPAYRRLFETLRHAVLSRQLMAGARLPATRTLASDLAISRNTVLQAYDQLLAEGYVEARTGSGTYIADTLPSSLALPQADPGGEQASAPSRALSRRGARLTEKPAAEHYEILEFVAGANDFSTFPHKLWQRLQTKYWREPGYEMLDYARAGGHPRLREAVCDYLRISRSVRLCSEQIILTSGTQQSLDLCARILSDPGDMVWMENPGYWGACRIFDANDLAMRPIQVDGEGMHPQADDLDTLPRMIYVTPSHQYPSDVVMSLSRRRLLVEFAARTGAWILEDDYDSEFRFGGRPLASLQGLDSHERVIYLGTFSKVLYPGIRVAYIVVPNDLVGAFRTGLADIQRPGQMAVQAALADFLAGGHFGTHVRNVRAAYGRSRALLQATLKQNLLPEARLSNADTGLHLVIHLPAHCDDRALVAEARLHSIDARPLSAYYIAPPTSCGLVIGYGYTPHGAVVARAEQLARIVNRQLRCNR